MIRVIVSAMAMDPMYMVIEGWSLTVFSRVNERNVKDTVPWREDTSPDSYIQASALILRMPTNLLIEAMVKIQYHDKKRLKKDETPVLLK